jgi:predicted nuclease of predicted toxin-antitoxin system
MIARMYSNENFPLPVVEALRLLGHDVLTTRDTGQANEGIPDDDVLNFATLDGRAVLTHNRKDFIKLHRTKPDHAGIIVCTQNPDFAALANKIHAHLHGLARLDRLLLRVNRGS